MHNALESLLALLEEEIARQERVLAATRAQGKAARDRDMKALETQTAALMALAQESAHAEVARKRLLCKILGTGIPDGATLGGIIALAPEPFASRLREFQARLKNLLHATREETRTNTVVMRLSLRVVGRALSAVEPYRQACSAGYAANGQEPASTTWLPALIDQKG